MGFLMVGLLDVPDIWIDDNWKKDSFLTDSQIDGETNRWTVVQMNGRSDEIHLQTNRTIVLFIFKRNDECLGTFQLSSI